MAPPITTTTDSPITAKNFGIELHPSVGGSPGDTVLARGWGWGLQADLFFANNYEGGIGLAFGAGFAQSHHTQKLFVTAGKDEGTSRPSVLNHGLLGLTRFKRHLPKDGQPTAVFRTKTRDLIGIGEYDVPDITRRIDGEDLTVPGGSGVRLTIVRETGLDYEIRLGGTRACLIPSISFATETGHIFGDTTLPHNPLDVRVNIGLGIGYCDAATKTQHPFQGTVGELLFGLYAYYGLAFAEDIIRYQDVERPGNLGTDLAERAGLSATGDRRTASLPATQALSKFASGFGGDKLRLHDRASNGGKWAIRSFETGHMAYRFIRGANGEPGDEALLGGAFAAVPRLTSMFLDTTLDREQDLYLRWGLGAGMVALGFVVPGQFGRGIGLGGAETHLDLASMPSSGASLTTKKGYRYSLWGAGTHGSTGIIEMRQDLSLWGGHLSVGKFLSVPYAEARNTWKVAAGVFDVETGELHNPLTPSIVGSDLSGFGEWGIPAVRFRLEGGAYSAFRYAGSEEVTVDVGLSAAASLMFGITPSVDLEIGVKARYGTDGYFVAPGMIGLWFE